MSIFQREQKRAGTQYIAHRINKINELQSLPAEYGIELDLRDDLNGRIYISHNPFEPGEDFEEYLKQYHHATMILNIKSERIELRILELLRQYKITDYFFLDSTFPMIYLLSEQREKRIALRLSEFEGMDTIRTMAGKVEWVWIDCFTKIPVEKREIEELKSLGYKTCFVSPELQGRDRDIEVYKNYFEENAIVFDAICTKKYNIQRWQTEQLKI